MNAPREPLHQPPNPDDLRRVPPGSPDCARVRGWMRDFADDDLEPARVREIEEHVHRCRVCSVELARAEHEVMRLRSAFALLPTGPKLPTGFAAALVERLILDETSMVSRETLAKASAAAAVVAKAEPAAPVRRGVLLHPVAYVFAAVLMLWGLTLGAEWFDGAAVVPRNTARLVLEAAADVFTNDRRLGVGDNVGEQQSLRVGRTGRATLSWHDPQPKSQPAALLHVHGDGQVGLEQGAPRIKGQVDVETYRPVSIPMADGSQLDLGVGEYSVSVRQLADDPLAAIPGELHIEIEVKSGQEAMIVRDEFGPTLVAPGFVGVYQTSTKADVVRGGGLGFGSVGSGSREPVAEETAVTGPQLVGHARIGSGEPAEGSFVMTSFGVAGLRGSATSMCASDGQFVQPLESALSTRFVIAQAMAPSWREGLGLLAPDAFRVAGSGSTEILQVPLVFESSIPFVGQLRDADGGGCVGVDVVPCIVDELFGSVLPLTVLRTQSDAHGIFRCVRLPARLPRHQSLVLLLVSDMHSPRAVPIPERGSVLASVPFPPIELQLLHSAMLHQLEPHQLVHVLEEIPGLPPGSAIVRRPALTDGAGIVASMLVGNGTMWVQVPGASGGLLRPLFLDQQGVVSRLQPGLAHVAWSEKFGPLQGIPATKAEVLHSTRHEGFATNPAQHDGSVLQLIDAVGRPAVAQVFALGAPGPRLRPSVRFLGFSGEDGRCRLPSASGSLSIVAVASDGSTAFADVEAGAEAALAPLQPTGRVLLDVSLRPPGVAVVPLVFERIDPPISGPLPTAVRFAAASTGWEVGNLPPGLYRVNLGSSSPQVQVPANGWGNLHN